MTAQHELSLFSTSADLLVLLCEHLLLFPRRPQGQRCVLGCEGQLADHDQWMQLFSGGSSP